MDTLGSLVDKLCIMQLKLAHLAELPDGKVRLFKGGSLVAQAGRCVHELNGFIVAAAAGIIDESALAAPACKIYPSKDDAPLPAGPLPHLIDYLAETNAALWATQEKVARIREIPAEKKDEVVERCFDLNMERSRTIDAIDGAFAELVNGRWMKRLQLDDAERLAAFYNSIPERGFFQPYGNSMDVESARKIVHESLAGTRDDVITTQRNQIVGWGFLRPRPRCNPKELSLGIAVHPDFRRKRVGNGLMRVLLSCARQRRLKSVRLIVVLENAPAICFYRKHGFQETATFINPQPHFVMRKQLCA